MITSGVTGIGTAGDAAVTLIASPGQLNQHVLVINEGTVDGFVSIDAGLSFARLPKQTAVAFDGVSAGNRDVEIQRIAGGDDLTDVFGAMW